MVARLGRLVEGGVSHPAGTVGQYGTYGRVDNRPDSNDSPSCPVLAGPGITLRSIPSSLEGVIASGYECSSHIRL